MTPRASGPRAMAVTRRGPVAPRARSFLGHVGRILEDVPDDEFRLAIEQVEWPGPAGAVVVTGPVTGRMPREPGVRFVVADGEEGTVPVPRLRIEANPRNGVLRIDLWGVDRDRVRTGRALRSA